MWKKIIPIFVFNGFWLWLLSGFLVGMISFKPTVPLEVIKDNKELLNEYTSIWSALIFKTSVVWAISGMILGLLVWLIFTYRPIHEHNTVMPRVAPESPFGSRPKTMAEAKTIFIVFFVSLIFSGLVHRFALPFLITPELLQLNLSKAPIVVSCIQTMLMSTLILPLSLKRIENLSLRGYFG